MALIRWEPARELGPFQSEVNRLFSTFFDTPTNAATGQNGGLRRWTPAMDITEAEGEYVLKADLPGLTEKDVNIEVQDNVLTLSGERRFEHADRQGGYRRLERGFGTFRRTLTLPEGVDAEAVKASFDHGVLEIRIPKPEQRRPRKVQISVGGSRPQATIEGSEAPAQA
ncbi:MAG TPA: Hsp20/alpha crystallin family protein [Solirubrobacteraceae bacterium]